MSTEELLENRRKQNAKNRIPDLKDDAFDISHIEIMVCFMCCRFCAAAISSESARSMGY